MTTDPRRPTIAGRLLELRSLIQTARWSLLDVVIMIDELYEQAVAIEQVRLPTSDPEASERDHEDDTNGTDE